MHTIQWESYITWLLKKGRDSGWEWVFKESSQVPPSGWSSPCRSHWASQERSPRVAGPQRRFVIFRKNLSGCIWFHQKAGQQAQSPPWKTAIVTIDYLKSSSEWMIDTEDLLSSSGKWQVAQTLKTSGFHFSGPKPTGKFNTLFSSGAKTLAQCPPSDKYLLTDRPIQVEE